MDLGLSGRTAVVISESGPFGPACASVLARESARVVLVVADPPKVATTDPRVRVVGGGLAEGATVVANLIDEVGHLDVVVVCHPLREARSVLSVTRPEELFDAWDAVVLTVAAYQAAIPSMIAQERGRLVAVTTTATKWLSDASDDVGAMVGLGLLGMHKAAVADVSPMGVTANAVLAEARNDPEEVASLVAFLSSEHAGYLDGIAVGMDGATSPVMF